MMNFDPLEIAKWTAKSLYWCMNSKYLGCQLSFLSFAILEVEIRLSYSWLDPIEMFYCLTIWTCVQLFNEI